MLLKCTKIHHWKAPTSNQALTLQAVGCCDQQIILNSRGFFFKHHFLTSVLVKCVHGAYKAKTNKPQVFEQSVEQPLQMASAMKEGLAVNVGLPGLKCH